MGFIVASNLSKEYTNKRVSNLVLDNINLTITEGEFVIIAGPSGSGKTTLLQLLSGLIYPTSGRVLINNNDIHRMSRKEQQEFRRRDQAFIFQDFNLISTLNAFDNVTLPLLIDKIKVKDSDVIAALEKVGLGDAWKLYPNEMSKGMQQRVAVARALLSNPLIIFADEPTGSLDEKNASEVMKLIKQINTEYKTTICLVTHNYHHLQYASRIIEIANAKIIRDEQL